MMKHSRSRASRCMALLLALCVAASVFTGLAGPAAAANTYNTGSRHTVCTALSDQAEDYYTGDHAWDTLSRISGVATDSSLAAAEGALYQALQTLMSSTQTGSVSYKSLTDYWPYTDASGGRAGTILFYSDTTGTGFNREHVWPKSRAGFYQKNGGSDLHHLRPTDSAINSTRSNYTMGDVAGVLSNYKTASYNGKTVLWYDASSDLVEVSDNVKGDVARILLYVYVRWGQPNLCENVSAANLPAMDSDDSDNNGRKVMEDLDTLLTWCEEDPVDTWEMSRNDCVEDIQGNRNVFVDYPEYAWLLFGRDVPEMDTPSGEARAQQDSYTVTAVSGNPALGSVTYAGRVITAEPRPGYAVAAASVSPAGAAELTRVGNTFRVQNVTADCTVTVRFEKAAEATVSFVTPDGAVQPMRTTAGTAVTLPDCAAPVEGWTFAGWAAAPVTETTAAPAWFAAGTAYTVTGDTTLYALYARAESGQGGGCTLVTAAPADWSGVYAVAAGAKGVMMNSDGSGGTYLGADDAALTGDTITNAGAENLFTLKKTGDFYAVQAVDGAYLRCDGPKKVSLDSGKSAVTAADTAYLWRVSVQGLTPAVQSYGALQYNAAAPRFTTYTSAQAAIGLYRAGATYYATFGAAHTHSYTDVVTPPGCTQRGYTTHTCACGAHYVDAYTEALGHAWDGGAVTTLPTPSADGEKTYTCTRCGETRTEILPATGACDGDASCPSHAFADRPAARDWAHAGVDYCVENGLMNGVSHTKFEPGGVMTRAMLVTILWRQAGAPAPAHAGAFTDLTQDWYRTAVAWAAEAGVVKGMTATAFAPDAPVTREQTATILYRYAKEVRHADVSGAADLSVFPDGGRASGYAKAELAWAVDAGLINGVRRGGTSYLEPQGSATRAQTATILMRFCGTVGM